MYYSVPAVEYKQGERTMYALTMDAGSLIQMVAPPEEWNPTGGPTRGNRPQDRKHYEGIANYLRDEPNPILGSVVLYVEPTDLVDFSVYEGQEHLPIRAGTLRVKISARYAVGDGQHRIKGLSILRGAHDDPDDPVRQRIDVMGIPVVLVVDEDALRMAQDFTDLQRNAKPPTTSLGASMDRRNPVNKFVLDLATDEDLPLLYDRVEFLKDSPGKLSAKLTSFKILRYLIGTALIGVTERTTRGWENAVNAAVSGDDFEQVREQVAELFAGLSEIEPYASIVSGESTVAEVRVSTYAVSGAVLYALGYALFLARTEDGIELGDAARALAAVNFDRPQRQPTPEAPLTSEESVFAGNIVESSNGKIIAGRDAWQLAGRRLHEVIRERVAQAVAA